MQTYTVQQAAPTGKVDPTFGTEYVVRFNEDQREVKLSRQNPITVGQQEVGDIIDNKYGSYFKKPSRDFAAPAQQFSAPQPAFGVATPVQQLQAPKPAWKDNTDGIRQGMCINNASNFVNSLTAAQTMTDSEWARTVFTYARALYLLGGLDKPIEQARSAQEIFQVSDSDVQNVEQLVATAIDNAS